MTKEPEVPGRAPAPPVAVGTTQACVRFDDLTLSRRGLLLLSNLEAVVGRGETLAVMGRSGAGKTTLLRTIAGLTHADSGRVERPPGRVPVVFQEPRLLPWRTARQNVELVLPKSKRHLAREWLTRVGLADAMEAYPAMLSGGMRQRVSIARALACEAPLLLVDEPFSNLDVVTARHLRQELTRQVAATGTTTIWVTHDPAEAAQVARRTLIIDGPPTGRWRFVEHPSHVSEERLAALLASSLTALHEAAGSEEEKWITN